MNPDILDDTPTLWRDMTPEQRVILTDCIETIDELYDSKLAQQARDALGIKPEPKVETAVIEGWVEHGRWWTGKTSQDVNHRITFNTIDGKPDPASIKMTAL